MRFLNSTLRAEAWAPARCARTALNVEKLLAQPGMPHKKSSWPLTSLSPSSHGETLPMAMSAEGLPIGVQLVGRDCDEAGLLRVAAQLETASPWAARRPPTFAG